MGTPSSSEWASLWPSSRRRRSWSELDHIGLHRPSGSRFSSQVGMDVVDVVGPNGSPVLRPAHRTFYFSLKRSTSKPFELGGKTQEVQRSVGCSVREHFDLRLPPRCN